VIYPRDPFVVYGRSGAEGERPGSARLRLQIVLNDEKGGEELVVCTV